MAASKSKLFAKGAEAELFVVRHEGKAAVLKRRGVKKYRAAALDERLRKERTRREGRLLHAAKLAGVRCPLVLDADAFKSELLLEKINGKPLQDHLKTHPKAVALLAEIGMALSALHAHGLVHGDFTASNVLVVKKGRTVVPVLIDFGLGSFATALEEQATDLLLFKKSVPAPAYAAFLDGYRRNFKRSKSVLGRLQEIELRGRYVVRAQAG